MTDRPTPSWRTPLVVAWRQNREFVERALESEGPRVCWAALRQLGATDECLALYYEVCNRSLDQRERAVLALWRLSEAARYADEDEGPDGDGDRVTANDLLAWEIVQEQVRPHPDGTPSLSYWGQSATRHSWLVAAAGVSAVDLGRRDSPMGYDDLAMLAALRGVRVPPLTPGEEFEPPTGVFVHPFQEVFRFERGWSWTKKKRFVGDQPG